SVSHLSRPQSWFSNLGQTAVIRNNKIVFFHHNEPANRTFDVYDIDSGTWSIGIIDIRIAHPSIISVNNEIYIAGGNINGISAQVWKLEF
ncbi:MAG TPA: hypothetical protein VLA58_00520, partial [Chitinophagaceae bacterium]|nr:hypothetical protein [Chitinophagaceae bacterium]